MFSGSGLNQTYEKSKYWSFEQALEFLATARKFGIRPGLERIKQLLNMMGNPQNAYPVIHIAGTNGKGSVSSMCAFIAAASGKRTGLFTSPYLTNFNERIRIIDGTKGLQNLFQDNRSAEISDRHFSKIMALIAFEVEVLKAKGFEMPTEFEMITAAAFIYFAEMNCDIVILETGLGGRLDSTNVCSNKIVNVITALSYDHVDRLGHTMAEIACEKAGIIQENVPTILYNPHDTELLESDAIQAEQVIREKAKELNSELTIVNGENIEILSSFVSGQSFMYQNHGPYHIQLAGDYQAQNASLAIEACQHITNQMNIEKGLSMAKWAGRLECLSKNPFLLVDGAHNIQGISGLKKYLEKFFSGQKIVILFGVLKDKAHEEMISEFLKSNLYQIAQIICTQPDFPRAMPAEELANEFAEKLQQKYPKSKINLKKIDELETKQKPLYNEILYANDLNMATKYAFDLARRENLPLISFGSLYMIGDVRPILLDLLEEEIS